MLATFCRTEAYNSEKYHDMTNVSRSMKASGIFIRLSQTRCRLAKGLVSLLESVLLILKSQLALSAHFCWTVKDASIRTLLCAEITLTCSTKLVPWNLFRREDVYFNYPPDDPDTIP